MKSNLAKMATAFIVSIVSFSAAVATTAPMPGPGAPHCPKIGNGKAPAEFNDVFQNPAGDGWLSLPTRLVVDGDLFS